MASHQRFSFARFAAMLHKEWLQMRRDPGTIGLTIAMPLIQLLIFGYAINTNPRHLPTAIVAGEHSRYERDIEHALTNTGYFTIYRFDSEHDADRAIARGDVLFAVHIPADFSRAVERGEQPAILLDADATDPTAIAAATSAIATIVPAAVNRDLPPGMQTPQVSKAFTLTVHARYNPEQITALNIVPGLIGTILMFSTMVITTLAITREREAGTMENLLAMPITPIEVMLGKIVPYVGLGYVQTFLILSIAVLLFHVPVAGSIPLLLLSLGGFIACNLSIGFTFSSIAKTQMQAQQMAVFVLLPSMMLSGFLFPFAGMPLWARCIGEVLPLTHILRICRGILLKGNGIGEIAPDLWPLVLFAAVVGTVAVRSYRRTLD